MFYRSVLLLVYSIAMSPAFLQAEIFRWIDSSGQVHYGDLPVGGSKKIEVEDSFVVEQDTMDDSRDSVMYLAKEALSLGKEKQAYKIHRDSKLDHELKAVLRKLDYLQCQERIDQLAVLEHGWDLRRKGSYSDNDEMAYKTSKLTLQKAIKRHCN